MTPQPRRCGKCAGQVFYDAQDEQMVCLQCGRRENLRPVEPLPLLQAKPRGQLPKRA